MRAHEDLLGGAQRAQEPLVIQIDAGQSRRDHDIIGSCVGRVQPPTHTDFHDCNIRLQLLEYRHRTGARQDIEFRDVGSKLPIQPFDFTPNLTAHVSCDKLAVDVD